MLFVMGTYAIKDLNNITHRDALSNCKFQLMIWTIWSIFLIHFSNYYSETFFRLEAGLIISVFATGITFLLK